MNAGAELIGERAGPLYRAVGQMHALDAALDQAEHHRARRSAGAQHQRIGGRVPARRAGVQIADESLDVGIGRTELAILVPQRIGGADRARALVRLAQRQRALLVREGDIGADKAVGRQMQHEFGEAFGGHRLDIVAALDAERPQPVVMDQRRARMRRRPSDQACGAGFCLSGHCGSCCGAKQTGVAAAQIGQAVVAVKCYLCTVTATIALKASAAAAANQTAARLIQ